MFQLSPLKKHITCQFISVFKIDPWYDHAFWNNCDEKLIPLLENFRKYITAPSILMYLLNHKKWDNIWEEVSGHPERLWLQLFNICL